MIHVALIGAGAHSLGCHAPALQLYAQQHPGQIALAALYDLDQAKAERAARQFGFARAGASLDEMPNLRNQIDAVVAVLPIAAMQTATPHLLALGVPLLIEKPLGRDVGEARELVRMIESHGASDRVMVSFNRRYDPGLIRGLEWAHKQGPIRHVRGTMIRSNRTESDFIWGTGIHLIDAVCHIAGPLTLQAALCPGRQEGKDDTWRVATLHGERPDTIVTLEIMPTGGQPWVEHIRIAGDEYYLEIQTGVAPPWIVRGYRQGQLEFDATHSADEPACVSNGTHGETVAFLEAVASHHPLPPPGIAEALASSELAEAIQNCGVVHR